MGFVVWIVRPKFDAKPLLHEQRNLQHIERIQIKSTPKHGGGQIGLFGIDTFQI